MQVIFGKRIMSNKIMLVRDSDEGQKKISSIEDLEFGIKLAESLNKELIQVSIMKEKGLPVCIIENIGKYKYSLSKKKNNNNRSDNVKVFILNHLIGTQDLDIKINKIIGLLDKLYKIRISFKRLSRFKRKKVQDSQTVEKNIIQYIENALTDKFSSFNVSDVGNYKRIEISPKSKKK